MNVYFKANRLDTGKSIVGFFTKKKIGKLIVPVIEVYKEWDSGDYMETHEIDGDTLIYNSSSENNNSQHKEAIDILQSELNISYRFSKYLQDRYKDKPVKINQLITIAEYHKKRVLILKASIELLQKDK